MVRARRVIIRPRHDATRRAIYHLAVYASKAAPVKKYAGSALLCILTAAPFVPGALEFIRRGIPDLAFGGDAAALEFGTWHAARGQQLLGAYSRFGWNHPGPAFFYLAAPLYEVLGERGPALNLFTYATELVCAFAIVSAAYRLGNHHLAITVAALLSVFELVALPFLLGNEWNPISPILPLVLICLLAALIVRGRTMLLPLMAFVGSVIVQTHVGYALAVVALSVYAVFRGRASARIRVTAGRVMLPTFATLLVCWALPLVEVWVTHTSNLWRLIEFFVPTPRHMAQQSWPMTIDAFARQAAVFPVAAAETLLHHGLSEPAESVALAITAAELFAVAAILRRVSLQNRGQVRVLAELTLLIAGVAVVSIRSIRGELLLYLVTWCAVCGFLAVVVVSEFASEWLGTRVGANHAVAMAAAPVVVALALTAPIERGSVIGAENGDVRRIAPIVDAFVRARPGVVPTIEIASHDTWPVAVGVALYLVKRRTPVAVEEAWLNVVGRSLRESPGRHPRMVVADQTIADTLTRRGFVAVASSNGVQVLFGAGE